MAKVRLALLGGFEVRFASGEALRLPTKKGEALLAYLARRPGECSRRDKLADLLWEGTPSQTQDSLRHTLAALRKALPPSRPAILIMQARTLAVNPIAVDVDVVTFEQLAATNDPERWEQAARLYQGDLLDGMSVNSVHYEQWLLSERERLRQIVLEILAKLFERQTMTGMVQQAIQTGTRILSLDPLQEVTHRAVMRLYIRQRRPDAALKQYEILARSLQKDLGVSPEPETRALYNSIRHHRALEFQ